MGFLDIKWSEDDREVIGILRDHARQMRLKGSAETTSTAGKVETLLNEILGSLPSVATSWPPEKAAPSQIPPPEPMPEIQFENYQNDTLILLQGQFLSKGGKLTYDLPPVEGECAAALLVEGDVLRVSLSGNSGRQLRATSRDLTPPGCSDPASRPQVFLFSSLRPSGLQLNIQASAGTAISFSILVHRAGSPCMQWLGSHRGCRALAGFLLRATLATLGVARFDLDGFLPDGALEKFCGALGGADLAPPPLREFLGRFEEAKIQRIFTALRAILTQVERPYDHLLTYLSQQLGAGPAEAIPSNSRETHSRIPCLM